MLIKFNQTDNNLEIKNFHKMKNQINSKKSILHIYLVKVI